MFAAIYNDADFGTDDAGISRLPALDARRIAGACVSAWSARIGDGQSTYRDGFVTAINARAKACGGEIGISARELVARLVAARMKEQQMNAPASNSARKLNGGQALAEMLKLSGVGPMFGMGGFQLLPFYEAMRALGLRHFLINDERCGAFASDAYARVTNRPGVCDATLGPGATNLVTATGRVAQCRHADDRHHRRRQSRARLEEHDAGGAAGRNPQTRREGIDPRRGDQAHPRAGAPRLRGCDERTPGTGRARRARGCLPRRA